MSLHSLALISSSPIGEGPNFRLDIDAQSAAQPERLGRGILAAHMPNRSNDFRTLVFLARASWRWKDRTTYSCPASLLGVRFIEELELFLQES
jgi:hypothetical protein